MTLSEDDIRRIIRAELADLLGLALRPKAPPRRGLVDPTEDVARFAATLAPGERVSALDLYKRWEAWALEAGTAPLTLTAFGRAAVRCGALRRGESMGRRVYVRA